MHITGTLASDALPALGWLLDSVFKDCHVEGKLTIWQKLKYKHASALIMGIRTEKWDEAKRNSEMNRLNREVLQSKQKLDNEVSKIKQAIKNGEEIKGQLEKNYKSLRNGRINDVKVS